MLGFVNNWFAPKANPIGVDFGSDCLRLAQVRQVDNECRLIAAASADVPSHVRHDPSARTAFFVEAVGDLLSQGGFQGRQAILSLPASQMFIQHLKLPRMDDAALKKALPWEARGKLPIDPTHALLRHMVAGDIYSDQDPKQEVILMAASREMVNQYLQAAARARLDVVGMNVEPKAVVDCFGWVHRRKTDLDSVCMYVDIGAAGTRAIIARGSHILFARTIAIGGDYFNKAVAGALSIGIQEARLLRVKIANQPADTTTPPLTTSQAPAAVAPLSAATTSSPEAVLPADDDENNSFALLGAGLARQHEKLGTGIVDRRSAQDKLLNMAQAVDSTPVGTPEARIHQACQEPLGRLCEELDLCRRYCESTFPSKPVSRLVFIGGEAQQRALCTHVARTLSLAAQVGDPMARMARTSDLGIESGIDRRLPQPSWAVTMGLSLGPVGGVSGSNDHVEEIEASGGQRH